MAINIKLSDALHRKLKRLAKRQPATTSCNAMGAAIIEKVVDACKDDPQAWQRITIQKGGGA